MDVQNLQPFPKSTQALLHDTDFKVQSNYIGNFTREFSPIIFDQNPIFRIYIKVLMGIGLSWTESSPPSLLTTPLRIPTSKKSLQPETDETYNCLELCALTQCNFCVFGAAMVDSQIVTIPADISSISADVFYTTFIFRFILATNSAQEAASRGTVDPAHVALHADRLAVQPIDRFSYDVAKKAMLNQMKTSFPNHEDFKIISLFELRCGPITENINCSNRSVFLRNKTDIKM